VEHNSLLNEIASQYFSPRSVTSIAKIERGLENIHYKIALSDGRLFFIKIFDHEPLAEKEASLVFQLAQWGERVPEIHLSRFGELYTKHLDKCAAVFTYITGAPLTQTPANLYQLGRRMAKVQSFKPSMYLGGYLYSPHALFTDIQNDDCGDPIVSGFFNKAARIAKSLPFDSLPKSFTHCDMTLDNIIDAGSQGLYLIDYEHASYENRLYDLSKSIIYCCRDNNQIDRGLCTELIRGYSIVSEITEVECRHLYAYVVYVALQSTFWRFREFCLRKPELGKQHMYVELLMPALDLVGLGEERFLREIFG
jgi:Ser/Thr protein kinase RdoA (MazF antagonist)